jgi:hypothetical protein
MNTDKNHILHHGLYRAILSCTIGRDALERKGRIPPTCSPVEYAMFNLLHAVEELAKERMEWNKKNKEPK